MRWLFPLFLVGCAVVPSEDPPLAKELKDPKRLWPVFQAFLRVELPGKAWDCLSREAKRELPKEAFELGMSATEVVPRLIQSLEEHGMDLKKGTIRLCSAEFGISKDFWIKSEFGGKLWTLDFTKADIDLFKDQAIAWFRQQTKSAGHRFYVYPPNWRYSKLLPTCRCEPHG